MPNIIRFGGGGKSKGGSIKSVFGGTYKGTVSGVNAHQIPLPQTVVPKNCAILVYATESYLGFTNCSITETTLTVNCASTVPFIYQVIEFDNIKSLQRGAFSDTGGGGTVKTININPVVIEKSLVLVSAPFHQIAGRDLADYNAFTLYYTWTNNTELRVHSRHASDQGNPVCWNVIEFE